MANILEEIAEATRSRIALEMEEIPLEDMKAMAEVNLAPAGRFYNALKQEGMSYICEVKKASPSKGLIAEDFPYLEIAREYEEAGAAAISCLTEPKWFLGSNQYLKEIASAVSIPVLKKDFTIDPYMIYQAAAYGASAILLICAILSDEELKSYRILAESLGLDALVEAHDETEIERAIASGARIIGVNNRNLKNFTVDTANSASLRSLVPPDILFVSESGIQTSSDVDNLRKCQVDAVLIGETLMRSENKKEKLRELNGGEAVRTPGEKSRKPKVKICGLYRPEDIEMINEARPDFCGFIIDFPKSHRSRTPDEVRYLRAGLAPGIVPVGVFVDEDPDVIADLLQDGTIEVAQLHGNETEDEIVSLKMRTGKPISKAIQIRTSDDIERAISCPADYILLDQGQGAGKTFDWSLINEEARRKLEGRKWFLAGGLDSSNIASAIESLHPWGLDLSSGVETEKVKDRDKVMEVLRIAREDR